MRPCLSFLAVILTALLLPQAARAATSDWVTTPGGDVRLVALPPASDGTARAILDIRLHDGWKTYWRDPAGSGIPPSLTITGATLKNIGFPAPKRLGDDALHYIGYDAPIALPLTLTGVSGPISASVFLGVCKDICIPVQAELTVNPATEAFANPLEESLIAAAEARLPAAANGDLAPIEGRWSADGKTLSVRFRAPLEGPLPEVYVSGPDNVQFGLAEAIAQDGDAYVARVPVLYRPKGLDPARALIRLTLRAGARTMESLLTVE
jgi:DsbC/DsbD-like thiol-disulfide interchange protein